jgi:hypothetical protein
MNHVKEEITYICQFKQLKVRGRSVSVYVNDRHNAFEGTSDCGQPSKRRG